jgi:hypothetical protein
MLRNLVFATVAIAAADAVIVAAGTLVLAPQQARATAAYAQETGKACGSCHTNPAGGGALTAAGRSYQKAKGAKSAAVKPARSAADKGAKSAAKKGAKPAAETAAMEPVADCSAFPVPGCSAIPVQDCSAFYDDYRRRGFGWGVGPGASLGFGTFEGALPRYSNNSFPNWYGECLNWGYHNPEPTHFGVSIMP